MIYFLLLFLNEYEVRVGAAVTPLVEVLFGPKPLAVAMGRYERVEPCSVARYAMASAPPLQVPS